MGLRGILALTLLAVAAPATGTELDEAEAKRLFDDGQAAYSKRDFARAYESFKQAYLLMHAPPLLYNMASSLDGMRRPHDAAEAFRAYLRTIPDEPDRLAIEARIRALEESQRLIDSDSHAPPLTVIPVEKSVPPVVPAPLVAPIPTVAPAVAVTPDATLLVPTAPPITAAPRPRLWPIAVVAGALALVGAGLGIVLAVTPNNAPIPSTFAGNMMVSF